jgi:hypothetical protein
MVQKDLTSEKRGLEVLKVLHELLRSSVELMVDETRGVGRELIVSELEEELLLKEVAEEGEEQQQQQQEQFQQ